MKSFKLHNVLLQLYKNCTERVVIEDLNYIMYYYNKCSKRL